MKKFRSRKLCLLLYPDEDISHKKALEYIKLNYDHAYIVHDKDKDEEGNLKKKHTHVVISLPNAKWNTSLSEEIGVPVNYIERCKSFDNALEYLIHFNDDSKFQYDISEVKGTLTKKLFKIINNYDKDENEKVLELLDFIENSSIVDDISFLRYCSSIGYYDVVRRSASWFMRIIDRHNSDIINGSYNIYYVN